MEPSAPARRYLWISDEFGLPTGMDVTGSDNTHDQFEALLRPHLDVLYRLAYRFTGQSADAEDLVQELMIRLYRNPQDLSQIAVLRPWLVRALHNLFIDHWRHQRRTPFGHLHPEPWDELFVNSDNGETPEREAQADDRRRRVLKALYGLGKDHRALLVLHDVEGHELPELSEFLHVPLGTLKSRLFRARRKMRDALGEWNPLRDTDVIAGETEVSQYGL